MTAATLTLMVLLGLLLTLLHTPGARTADKWPAAVTSVIADKWPAAPTNVVADKWPAAAAGALA